MVGRLDRLARRLVTQEAILAQVWKNSGRVFTADQGEILQDDPEDPMRTAMRQMMGIFSELEHSMIVTRLRAGRREKAVQGGYAYGAPPYGWHAVAGELVEQPTEQVGLARARELRAAGASLREICRQLEAEQIPPRRSDRWHPEAVRRMLQYEVPYTLRPRTP